MEQVDDRNSRGVEEKRGFLWNLVDQALRSTSPNLRRQYPVIATLVPGNSTLICYPTLRFNINLAL